MAETQETREKTNVEVLTIYTMSEDGASYSPFLAGDEHAPVRLVTYQYVSERMGTTKVVATLKWHRCLDADWTGREFVVMDESQLGESSTDTRTVMSLEKFYLLNTPLSSKSNEDERYVHTLEFHARRDILLASVYYCDAVGTITSPSGSPYIDRKYMSNSFRFMFNGNLYEFVMRFRGVLAYMGLYSEDARYPTLLNIVIDSDVTSDEKSLVKEVSFDDSTLFEALKAAYEAFNVPFYFEGDVIHFGRGGAVDDNVTFDYGPDEELLSIAQTGGDSRIVTMISGYGSSDNLPYYYPNPTPKGTLGTGGTASGVSVVNQRRFAERVGIDDTLTYVESYPSKEDVSAVVDGTAKVNPLSWGTTFKKGDTAQVTLKMTVKVPTGIPNAGDFNIILRPNLRAESHCEYAWLATVDNRTTMLTIEEVRDDQHVAPLVTEVLESAYVSRIPDVESTTDRSGDISIPKAYLIREDGLSVGDHHLTLKCTLKCVGALPEYYRILIQGVVQPNVEDYTIFASVNMQAEVVPDAFSQSGASAPSAGWLASPSGAFFADLSEAGLSMSGEPSPGDTITQTVEDYLYPSDKLLPSVYRDSSGTNRWYYAVNGRYMIPGTGEDPQYYEFENTYDPDYDPDHDEQPNQMFPRQYILEVPEIRPHFEEHFEDIYFEDGFNVTDTVDDGETLRYQHFFVKLPALGFNLFECASENAEMTVNMLDGDCAGCKFKIRVNSKNMNEVQVDDSGDLVIGTDGRVRLDNGNIQPQQNDTTSNEVWLALYLDDETYGGGELGTLPNGSGSGQTIVKADGFTFTGINLPESYLLGAEEELKERLIKFMWENNRAKTGYSIKISRVYLAQHESVKRAISAHASMLLYYAGNDLGRFHISQYSYKANEGECLPEIDVELSDIVDMRTSGLEQKISAALKDTVNIITGGALSLETVLDASDGRYVRRDVPETLANELTLEKGVKFGKYKGGTGGKGGSVGINPDGTSTAVFDYLNVRRKATFTELEIDRIKSVGGKILVTLANIVIDTVECIDENGSSTFKCTFSNDDESGRYPENGFEEDDLAICRSFSGNNDRFYWRKVLEVGQNYVVLSNNEGEYAENSDVPARGDNLVQLGNTTDTSRQAAQIISCYDDPGSDVKAPYTTMYYGIDDFTLDDKEQVVIGMQEIGGVLKPKMTVYGDMYVGNRNNTSYMEWDSANSRLRIKGAVNVSPGGDYSSPTTVFRGAWTSGSLAYYGDIWTYGGSSWICIDAQALTAATAVTTAPALNDSHWAIYAKAGEDGEDGAQGADGQPGVSSAEISMYKNSSTGAPTDMPSGAYNFETGKIIGLFLRGWSQTIVQPEDGEYTYVIKAFVTDAGTTTHIVTVPTTAWSAAVRYNGKDGEQGAPGTPGANGYNTAEVTVYRAEEYVPPYKPHGCTYNFETGELTGDAMHDWTTEVPEFEAPEALYQCKAYVRSQLLEVDIPDNAWGEITRVSGTPGTPGAPGAPGTDGYNTAEIKLYNKASGSSPSFTKPSDGTYTFSTGVFEVEDGGTMNGWSQNMPVLSAFEALYVISANVMDRLDETDVDTEDWSDPVRFSGWNGNNGNDGLRGKIMRGVNAYSSLGLGPDEDDEYSDYQGLDDTDTTHIYFDVVYAGPINDRHYYYCKTEKYNNKFAKEYTPGASGSENVWVEADHFDFVATRVLLAGNAYIDVASGNAVYMYNDDQDAIVAGMQGGSGINFFAGANVSGRPDSEDLSDAPFRVYHDGTMVAQKGSFGLLSIGRDGVWDRSYLHGEYVEEGSEIEHEITIEPEQIKIETRVPSDDDTPVSQSVRIAPYKDTDRFDVDGIVNINTGNLPLTNSHSKAIVTNGSIEAAKVDAEIHSGLKFTNGTEDAVMSQTVKHIVSCTQAQYEAIYDPDDDTLYIITDAV